MLRPTRKRARSFSIRWRFSYELAELILLWISLSSKGSVNTLTPFMRVIKQPLLGIRGSRLGRDCPGWLMRWMGMVARLGASELWAYSEERRGGGAYWVIDSLVKQRQMNLLGNSAAASCLYSVCLELLYFLLLWSIWSNTEVRIHQGYNHHCSLHDPLSYSGCGHVLA